MEKKWSANTRGYTTSDPIPFHTDGGNVCIYYVLKTLLEAEKYNYRVLQDICETLKRKSLKGFKNIRKGFGASKHKG